MSELKRELHASHLASDTASSRQDKADPADTDPADIASAHEQLTRSGQAGKLRRFAGKGVRKKKGKKRRVTLAVLPTLLTLSNAVCGLSAIAIATSQNLQWENDQKLLAAGVLIFVGMLFDALDGSAARMTGQASKFGAELDSLCDVITFGTAPAVIVWHINEGNALPQKLALAIGVLFTLCVIIRLARFNVETPDDDAHEGFDGLPSPAAAGTLAAFMIAVPELSSYAKSDYPEIVQTIAKNVTIGYQYFIPVLALVLAYLMVSRFQYPHVFQQLLRGRRAPHKIGQLLFVLIGAVMLHWLALPLAFCYYAFASPLRTWVGRLRHRHEVVEAT
jgi:CDP-diacylglycerol--serine O-phosphatidyltransferase